LTEIRTSQLNSLAGRRVTCMMLAIFCVTNLTRCSTKGSSTASGKDAPGGRVEVSGTTTDDDPTEFKQADESVQIGGVNLTGNQNLTSQYVIKAYLVSAAGKFKVYTGVSSSKDFKFSINRASSYVVVDVTSPSGKTKSAIIAPSFAVTTVRANLTVNRITDVAAKLLSIAHEKVSAGDANAITIFSHYLFSVPDMIMSAASAVRVIDQQQKAGVTADPIDLTNLAQSLMQATVAKVNQLATEYSPIQYAQKVSAASYESIYRQDLASISPDVLAYRANPDLGSSTAAATDVTYTAIVASENRFLNAAYRVESTVYRTANTSADAGSTSTASTVSSTFEAFYQVCVNAQTCVSSSFTPSTPPGDGDGSGGSSGGGSSGGGSSDGGSSDGGSSGGGSSGGGSSGGGSNLAIQSASIISSTLASIVFSGGVSGSYTVFAYTDDACSSQVANSTTGASSPRTVTLPIVGVYYFKVNGTSENSPCFGPVYTVQSPPPS
jgi:hypothetical protein